MRESQLFTLDKAHAVLEQDFSAWTFLQNKDWHRATGQLSLYGTQPQTQFMQTTQVSVQSRAIKINERQRERRVFATKSFQKKWSDCWDFVMTILPKTPAGHSRGESSGVGSNPSAQNSNSQFDQVKIKPYLFLVDFYVKSGRASWFCTGTMLFSAGWCDIMDLSSWSVSKKHTLHIEILIWYVGMHFVHVMSNFSWFDKKLLIMQSPFWLTCKCFQASLRKSACIFRKFAHVKYYTHYGE